MNELNQGLFDAGHDAGVSDGVMEVVSYSLNSIDDATTLQIGSDWPLPGLNSLWPCLEEI